MPGRMPDGLASDLGTRPFVCIVPALRATGLEFAMNYREGKIALTVTIDGAGHEAITQGISNTDVSQGGCGDERGG